MNGLCVRWSVRQDSRVVWLGGKMVIERDIDGSCGDVSYIMFFE